MEIQESEGEGERSYCKNRTNVSLGISLQLYSFACTHNKVPATMSMCTQDHSEVHGIIFKCVLNYFGLHGVISRHTELSHTCERARVCAA